MSKLTKLYTLIMCSFVYQLYFNKAGKPDTTEQLGTLEYGMGTQHNTELLFIILGVKTYCGYTGKCPYS